MNSRHLRSESFPLNPGGDTTYRVGNSLFLRCSKCKARRPIFGEAREWYDAMTKVVQKELAVSFTCTWVANATFENSCSQPPVFARAYDWWYDLKEGKDIFVGLGGKVVDHTRLFFFVQACDNELRKCEEAEIKRPNQFATSPVNHIWKAIARRLGFSKPREGTVLKEVYLRTFRVSKTSGGSDFETELRDLFDCELRAKRTAIHSQMLTSLSDALKMVRGSGMKLEGRSEPSAQAPAAQPQRVRLYEEPPVLPARAEKLLEQIKKVHEATRDLGDENVAVGPIHERTRDIFKQLADATLFSAAAESNDRRTLPFVADTGTGKSHTIDNVLRLSECPNGEYRHDMQVQDLESVKFISSGSLTSARKEAILQEGGGGARAMSEAPLPAAAGVASLSPRNETQEALLDGIERVSAIINGGEVDSIVTASEHRTVHALSPHAVCMCPPE